jgi:hypothetical protein
MKRLIFTTAVFVVCLSSYSVSQTIDTARLSSINPGFSYGNYGQDVVNGTPFYLLENDSALVCISTVKVNNNQQGGIHKGAPMDVVHRRKFRENIDWAQFIISPTILTSWNYPTLNLTLDSFWLSNDSTSVYAYGIWNNDSSIKVLAHYSLLPGSPILKIKLLIINQGTLSFNGYLAYQVDPDEVGEQEAYVPGVGWGNTQVNSGWNKNYVYDGVGQGAHSNNPAHGIAWFINTPAAILSPGFIFGVWFDVSTPAGDTTELSLYHITDVPENLNVPNYSCIEKWVEPIMYLDPDLSSFSKVSGVVKDVNNVLIPAIPIAIRDIYGNLHAQTATDSLGHFEVFIEKGVYTFTASGIGYAIQSRSIDCNIDSILDFTNAFNAALQPVTVWAGHGKVLKGGIVQGTETDLVMENNQLAVSIANTSIDGQLPYSSLGRPLDLAVTGTDDDLDWIHLSFASKLKPSGTEAWDYESVRYDTVYVSLLNPNIAIVKAEGHYFELQGVNNDSVVIFSTIPVKTTYTIEPGKKYIYTETEMENNTSSPQSFWIGDVIDHDGAGQNSYVPGFGSITSAYSNPAMYTPSLPWMAMTGNSPQAYGFIYEGSFGSNFTAYGNGSWIMSMDSISMNPGTSYLYKRYLVAAGTNGYPNKADAIQDVYSQLITQQTGISGSFSISKDKLHTNDTLLAKLTISNSLSQASMALDINLQLPGQLASGSSTLIHISGIPANSDTTLSWILSAHNGGRGFIRCLITDTANQTTTNYACIFVNGRGWYAGDNHMHTKFSDGSGTVADNVVSAYQKGLSWVTVTDHNTIDHAAAVAVEDAKYDDFLVMFGEEVSTSPSHFLAYNITNLIPWNASTYSYQQLIDSALHSNNGKGIVYLAHPFYPGLPWTDWSVTEQKGIEVWNGFYHATHSVNSQAFGIWDSLNTTGKRLFGIANSDAHNSGKVGDPHIVALLDSLCKEEVMEAFNTGCFYGTNGPGLAFDIEGIPMGSAIKVPAAGRAVTIHIEGFAGQAINALRIIKNGQVLYATSPMTDTTALTYATNMGLNDFFRVEMEAGNGFAFSNPVWADLGNDDALAKSIRLDNILLNGFADTVYQYAVQFPAGTTHIPVVTAEPSDTNASLMIVQATNLNGTLMERTAKVQVTAEDGVAMKVYNIVFSLSSGTDELKEDQAIECYPVPTSSQVVVEFSSVPANTSFELFGMNGKVILSGSLDSMVNSIDLGPFANGTYFIKIYKNGICLSNKKLVKIKQ